MGPAATPSGAASAPQPGRRTAVQRVRSFVDGHPVAYRLSTGLVCAVAYYAVLQFFLGIPVLNDQIQVRPASAMGPVLSLFFGWPAIVGCALGNLVSDASWESDPALLAVYFLVQLAYNGCAYLMWYRAFGRRPDPFPGTDTPGKAAFYLLAMATASVLVTLLLLPVAQDNVSEAGIDAVRIFNNFLFLVYLGIPLLFALCRSPLVPLAPPSVRARYERPARMNLTQLAVTATLFAALAIIIVFILARFWPYFADPSLAEREGSSMAEVIGSIYWYATGLTLLVFLPALGVLRAIETRITRPIEVLTEASRSFVDQLAGSQGIAAAGGPAGRTEAGAARRSGAAAVPASVDDVPTSAPGLRPRGEVLELIESTNAMRHDLVGYLAQLAGVAAERERTAAELEIAASIQASTVPHDFTSFIERYHLDVSALLQPAREVGGDFYDVFDAGEHRVGLVVADVSGKGVPAALFMMRALTEIREQMVWRADVGEALTIANQKLCEHNDAMLFVTAFACVLDIQTGLVSYANAGHNPPWLRHGAERRWLADGRGLVLGALGTTSYRSHSVSLTPGDGLFLYTDGVTEAMDENERLFGQGALEDALREADDFDMVATIEHVRANVDRFVGDAPQADDMTMLAFKWNLPVRSIALPPDDRALDDLFAFIDRLCEDASCSKKVRFDLKLVLEELFVNVAHYGFPEGQPRQSVHVEAAIDKNAGVLHIAMSDAGIPYDPLAYRPERVDAEKGEENKVGGLGILLVRERTDGITYERASGLNVVRIVKEIG